MTSLYLVGGGLLTIAFAIWFLVRNAKKQGAAEQRADDLVVRSDAEEAIHEVQLQDRPTPETIKRLDDGTF